MEIAYEIKEGEAIVWRCYEYGTEAELPGTIEGRPVTELAPYVFSAHMDEKLLEQKIREGKIRMTYSAGGGERAGRPGEERTGLPPALKGTEITAVSLPPGLRKIGAYAFYNCSRLRKISFYGSLSDLGAGLFTGCHAIRELKLTLDETYVSCLREILMEVPEKLMVTLKGSVRGRLVFPEFFEESVENTPARILVTQMHGSGMNFRNCFYDRKFDFKAYDACFYMAKAGEDFDTVLEMVLSRLMYPVQLSSKGRQAYEDWLFCRLDRAMEKAVLDRDMETLEYLAACTLKGQEADTEGRKEKNREDTLRKAASFAASHHFPEGTSFLMSELYQVSGAETEEKRERKKERFAL